MKVLFLGDSITDMSRSREGDNVYKGNGYVFYAAGDIKREDPSIEVINRGISGNRVVDLYARITHIFVNGYCTIFLKFACYLFQFSVIIY